MLTLGMMSGTSGDGISMALVEYHGRRFRLRAHHTFPYPAPLSKKIFRIVSRQNPVPLSEIALLNRELGEFFSREAVLFLRRHGALKKVGVIGSHGHTLFHGPDLKLPSTIQIGEAGFLVERTGIPVVSDFRQADIAAGGEGAPLMPFFDREFFGRGPLTACQNIGGISNVTAVGKNAKRVVAFDNGPGNCLIDEAMRKFFRLPYDESGRVAATGRVRFESAAKILKHSYFRKTPPKSTGRELFRLENFKRELRSLRGKDLIATLTYFTAYSIADSYRRFLPKNIRRVIVSGGGTKNFTLMNHLKALLHPFPVYDIERYGIPTLAKEPMAFAYFAYLAIQRKTNHLPSVTGARRSRILGKISYPA